MKIYLSGPISGMAERNLPAFHRAAREVTSLGHEAVIPHECPPVCGDGGCAPGYDDFDEHSSACYLRGDLMVLLGCAAAYFLAGWERSRGACLEHNVARECGLELFYQDGRVSPPFVPSGRSVRWFSKEISPPLGEHIRLMTPRGERLTWTGKRWFWDNDGDDVQNHDAWPPDVPGPYFEVTS